MSDLIRREDAINSLRERFCGDCKPCAKCDICHTDDLIRAVAEIPPVDAVEVVRCKDCCYFTPVHMYGGIAGRCSRMFESRALWASGYCSMGVKKEDIDASTDV